MTHIIVHKNDAKRTNSENLLILKNNFDDKTHFLCEKIDFCGIIFQTLDIIYYTRNEYGEPVFAQFGRFLYIRARQMLFFCSPKKPSMRTKNLV